MPRGQAHSDETRASVLAALLAGQSVNEVARTYHLSNATVLAWRTAAGQDPGSTPVQPQKRAALDDLLFSYVRQALTALHVQQELFATRSWLEKQPASELAVLHGVSADKVVRILEAVQRSGDAAAEDPAAESGPADVAQ